MSHPNILRFTNWLAAEKTRGLVDLKGLCTDGEGFLTKFAKSDLAARDELCAEFMRMVEAPDLPDPDLDREVLPSIPGQRGSMRADTLQGTYNYFSNRFNQLKS